MADSPLLRRLRQRARQVGSRAMDEILASESRTDALGAAVRRVQQGRRTLDETSARLLGSLGLATQDDLNRLEQRVGKLRKRLRRILDDLEQ